MMGSTWDSSRISTLDSYCGETVDKTDPSDRYATSDGVKLLETDNATFCLQPPCDLRYFIQLQFNGEESSHRMRNNRAIGYSMLCIYMGQMTSC